MSTDLVLLADATVAPPPVGTVIHGDCWVCFAPATTTVTPAILKTFRVPTLYCGPECAAVGKERRRASWVARTSTGYRRERTLSESPLRGPRSAPEAAVWVSGACGCGSAWTKPVTDPADVAWVSSYCSPGCYKRSQDAERSSRVAGMAAAARAASKAFMVGRVVDGDARCSVRPDKIPYLPTPDGLRAAERACEALRTRTGSVAPEVYLCPGSVGSAGHYHVGNWGPTARREERSRRAS